MTEPMSDERDRWIREYLAINPQGLHAARELLAELDRVRATERHLREANLLLHADIERVRIEAGGTRNARVEWRVEHPARAPFEFGADEQRARECLAREVGIWGPGGWRLRSRLTFLGDWRDEAS